MPGVRWCGPKEEEGRREGGEALRAVVGAGAAGRGRGAGARLDDVRRHEHVTELGDAVLEAKLLRGVVAVLVRGHLVAVDEARDVDAQVAGLLLALARGVHEGAPLLEVLVVLARVDHAQVEVELHGAGGWHASVVARPAGRLGRRRAVPGGAGQGRAGQGKGRQCGAARGRARGRAGWVCGAGWRAWPIITSREAMLASLTMIERMPILASLACAAVR